MATLEKCGSVQSKTAVTKMAKLFQVAMIATAMTGIGAPYQEAAAADNPLIGTWISINKGYGACDEKRTFSANSQTWYTNGQVTNAPATYAFDGSTVYVQMRGGSNGTVAYIVVSPDEIMDNLGTNACHWRRE